jgi:diaminohydroxyphosphoribosylaminopyrimidine deaminase/5-amino-6-(5-phosphoribosylamino)uracil reductase
VRTAPIVPLLVAMDMEKTAAETQHELRLHGAEPLPITVENDAIDLPALLETLAERGISSLIVEGGAKTAAAFLEADLVDRIAVFTGPGTIGEDGVRSPLSADRAPDGFHLLREARYGSDGYREYSRTF